MKKGITITQRFELENITSIDEVSEAIFSYSDTKEEKTNDEDFLLIKKMSKNEVSFADGKFIIPLSQADTNELTKVYYIEAQLIFNSGATNKWNISTRSLSDTLRTEDVSGESDGTETEDITMSTDEIFHYTDTYTKDQIDEKDAETLSEAKGYTDGKVQEIDVELGKKQKKLTPEYGIEFINNKINVKLADTGQDGFLIFSNTKGLRFNWVLLGRYSSFRQELTDEDYDNPLVSKADMLYELLNYGIKLTATIDPTTYVMTMQLKNSLNEVLSTATLDLPLESMVVSGDYDAQTKKVILTLQSGQTVEFSVADLISGLVSTGDLQTALEDYQLKITSTNKLDADLLDDSTSTKKLTTQAEKDGWDAKEDPTNIEKDSTSTTVSLTLENNTENRYTEDLTDLTISLPQTIDDDFISGVVFASGTIPTAMTYDSSIKWTGDDVNNNVFVPAADKTYNFIIWNDGININAIVRGVA